MGQKNGFSSVWEWEENRRSGIPGRKFSLPGPQNFSSQIGRKSNEGKQPHCNFTVMPSHQPAFMPFTYTPDDFCPHKILIAFLIFSSLPLAPVKQTKRRKEKKNKVKRAPMEQTKRRIEEKKKKKKKKEKWRAPVEQTKRRREKKKKKKERKVESLDQVPENKRKKKV